MTYDPTLARRFINKMGKEIITAFSKSEQQEVRDELQRALNDLTFFVDILHLEEEIQMIDINANPKYQLNKGGKKKNGNCVEVKQW